MIRVLPLGSEPDFPAVGLNLHMQYLRALRKFRDESAFAVEATFKMFKSYAINLKESWTKAKQITAALTA